MLQGSWVANAGPTGGVSMDFVAPIEAEALEPYLHVMLEDGSEDRGQRVTINVETLRSSDGRSLLRSDMARWYDMYVYVYANVWMDGWMDGWMCVCVCVCVRACM